MSAEEPITVTLPIEASNRIRAKIANEGYSGPEKVIEEGLYALDPAHFDVERWLREEIVPYCDAIDKDTSKLHTVAEVDAAWQPSINEPSKQDEALHHLFH